jgi:phosphatidate cytidylyltransferase
MLSLLTDIRSMQHPLVDDLTGFRFTLLVLAMVWLTDTFAYYVGKSVGRHPLMPRVSPKKTWEGFIGGCLGAIVAVISLKIWMLPMLSWLDVLVLSFIGGVISPLGDLAESRIKRSMQVKDSGGLLPGHGGVLDRFDAMLVTAPLVYLYLTHVVLP